MHSFIFHLYFDLSCDIIFYSSFEEKHQNGKQTKYAGAKSQIASTLSCLIFCFKSIYQSIVSCSLLMCAYSIARRQINKLNKYYDEIILCLCVWRIVYMTLHMRNAMQCKRWKNEYAKNEQNMKHFNWTRDSLIIPFWKLW